jgi:hypothetical protein
MLVYAVVSRRIQEVVEVFSTHAEAETMVARVRADEPDLAALLEVVAIEFTLSPN